MLIAYLGGGIGQLMKNISLRKSVGNSRLSLQSTLLALPRQINRTTFIDTASPHSTPSVVFSAGYLVAQSHECLV